MSERAETDTAMGMHRGWGDRLQPIGIPRHSPIVAALADEPMLAELKRRARAMWAAGDYAEVARRELWSVDIDWVEGDAEALPFADECFDVVVSTLGATFAPRHSVVARELGRVLRPGGRLAVCSWAQDSVLARVLQTIAAYLPPPPGFARPPWLWGSEEHVRSLFAGTGIELEFERGMASFPAFGSAEEDVGMSSRPSTCSRSVARTALLAHRRREEPDVCRPPSGRAPA